MDPSKAIVTLLTFAFLFGAITMIVKNPSGANTILASGVDLGTGALTSLEGRGPTNSPN